MKTLLIFIVLLAITGCASAPQGISRSQEMRNIIEQSRMDMESGKITFEQHIQNTSRAINAMPDHTENLAAQAAQQDSARVLMETGARLLGGGGFGYNQPRLQTTCVQQGMFTQCW